MTTPSWTTAEIKKLFETVAKAKSHGQPIMAAFKDFASRFARRPLSVRNFYYARLKHFEQNPHLAEKLGINLSLHQKTLPTFFTSEEELSQISEVERLVAKGHSVRSACQTLSGGSIQKMLRLQNKYHASHRQKNNILFMPTPRTHLTDEDLSSLVMGLVKLVSRTGEEKLKRSFEDKLRLANHELRKTIKALAEKQREFNALRKEFDILSTRYSSQEESIARLRSLSAPYLARTRTSKQKLCALKAFTLSSSRLHLEKSPLKP